MNIEVEKLLRILCSFPLFCPHIIENNEILIFMYYFVILVNKGKLED